MTKQNVDRFAITLLLVLCVMWGMQQVAIKVALDSVSPLMQAGLRSLVAVLLLCGWMRWKGMRVFERDGAEWWGLLAGMLFSLEFMLLYWALEYTTASRSTVFLYTSPFVVALGVHLFVPGEKLGLTQVIGLCCAFSGIVIAFGEEGELPDGAWIGDMMAIGAAIFWGATTVVVKASPQRTLKAERVLLYQLGVSALLLPLGSVLSGESGITDPTPLVWASLAFQAVVVAFISYLAWYWLIHHYPASRIASFGFISPMFGVLFGYLLLDEALSLTFVLALLLVAAGIFLVNRPVARRAVQTSS